MPNNELKTFVKIMTNILYQQKYVTFSESKCCQNHGQGQGSEKGWRGPKWKLNFGMVKLDLTIVHCLAEVHFQILIFDETT